MTSMRWLEVAILTAASFCAHGLEVEDPLIAQDQLSSIPAITINAPTTTDTPIGTPIIPATPTIEDGVTVVDPLRPTNSSFTIEPTKSPITLEPTRTPSLEPSPSPTTSPTNSPSISHTPTLIPSLLPSASASPSYPPSLRPSTTRSPSAPPSTSTAPTYDTQYAGSKMTLFGIRSIEDLSDWEDATASYYQSVYNNNGNDNGGAMMEDAVVKIRLTNQNTINVNGRRIEQQQLPKQRHSRMLQQTATKTSVVITYSQSTTYRSIDPNLDVATMLRLPLSTDDYRGQYMQGLKLNLDGYEDLESVSSISTPYDDDADDADGNRAVDGTNDAGGLSMFYIIGIACGAAAFLLLVVGGFIYYRRTDKKDKDALADVNGVASTAPGDYVVEIDSPSGSPERYSKRIDTAESRSPAIGDTSVASQDGYHPELFDESAEELLTIYAPAGKLGIVIDSPDDGAPVIHNVKETSPIADKVREGDRLVGVDEEDVRTMTAIKVSKLISRKSSNSRRLVVIRYVASN